MSYILDALNKSESERQRQAIPGIASLKEAKENATGSLPRFLIALIIFGAINIAVIYYVLERWKPPDNPAPGSPAISITANPLSPAPEARQSPPADVTLMSDPRPAGPREIPVATPGDIKAPDASDPVAPVSFGAPEPTKPEPLMMTDPPPAEPSDITTFAELPVSLQRRIPEIEVTTHIYSNDPALRVVKIDGVAKREGDSLEAGLTLVRITELGIVLGIDGRQFKIDILQDWNNL